MMNVTDTFFYKDEIMVVNKVLTDTPCGNYYVAEFCTGDKEGEVLILRDSDIK